MSTIIPVNYFENITKVDLESIYLINNYFIIVLLFVFCIFLLCIFFQLCCDEILMKINEVNRKVDRIDGKLFKKFQYTNNNTFNGNKKKRYHHTNAMKSK